MALYAQALRALGAWLGAHSARAAIAAAGGGSAQRSPRSSRDGHGDVPTTAASTSAHRSSPPTSRSPASPTFDDLDRLTIFADNLVPHVLRCDGVLVYEESPRGPYRRRPRLCAPAAPGTRDPRLRGARLRAARSAPGVAPRVARQLAVEPRPGAASTRRGRGTAAELRLLLIPAFDGARTPGGRGPVICMHRSAGFGAAPTGRTPGLALRPPTPPGEARSRDRLAGGVPPSSATIRSSSPTAGEAADRLGDRVGQMDPVGVGPPGRRPSTRTGWPGLPTTVELGGTSA